MLLLYCHRSCSPWFNSRRCTDLFSTLPHQVYYLSTVHLSFFPRDRIIPSPLFIVMKGQSWPRSDFISSAPGASKGRSPDNDFTWKQSPGTTIALVCDWTSINLTLCISLQPQNSGGMPACTDESGLSSLVDFQLHDPAWQHKALAKYVVKGIDWSQYCNPYNT